MKNIYSFILTMTLAILLPVDVILCQWVSCPQEVLMNVVATHGICLGLAGVFYLISELSS